MFSKNHICKKKFKLTGIKYMIDFIDSMKLDVWKEMCWDTYSNR
jgi:hypothetical protein